METKYEKKNGAKFHSMKVRIAILLTLAAVFLTVALAAIGLRQFVNASRQDHIAIARGATSLAAEILDADRIGAYLTEGKSRFLKSSELKQKSKGETEFFLFQIRL